MLGKLREVDYMERQQVGVRFLLPNRTWKPIETLLATIDFRSYYWEIRNDEICGWRDISGVYQGAEVIQALPLTKYYCISMILKGFVDDRVEHIPNYSTMCKSSCEIYLWLMMLKSVQLSQKPLRTVKKYGKSWLHRDIKTCDHYLWRIFRSIGTTRKMLCGMGKEKHCAAKLIQ